MITALNNNDRLVGVITTIVILSSRYVVSSTCAPLMALKPAVVNSATQRELQQEAVGIWEQAGRSRMSVASTKSVKRPITSAKYRGMEAADIRRLRELEEENRLLKQISADLLLEKRASFDAFAGVTVIGVLLCLHQAIPAFTQPAIVLRSPTMK